MSRSHSGKSLAHRVLRAGFAVSIAHLLFKLAGLWQARVMGHLLPAETYDVVYAFAFENCIFSLFLIGEEVLGPACLPVFMTGREIARWEGGVFLGYYIAYVAYLLLAAQQHDVLPVFSSVMMSFVVPLTVVTLVVVVIRRPSAT